MADPSKQNLYTVSVGVGGAGGGEGGNLMSNLKSLFSVLRTRRTKLFAYGFIFTFVAFTAFLAFSPSANSASPWFNNIFSLSTTSDSTNFDSSGTSQFSSLFSYLFPNSSQPILQTEPNTTRSNSNNTTDQTHNLKQSHFNETIGKFNQTINTPTKTSTRDSSSSKNQTVKGVTEQNRVSNETVKGVAEQNRVSNFPDSFFPKIQTVKGVTEQNRVSNSTDSSSPKNQTVKGVTELNRVSNFTDSSKNLTVKGIGITEQNRGSSYTNSTVKGVTEENRVSNYTDSLPRKNNTTSAGNSTKGENPKNEKKGTSNSLMHCDIFDGKWVKDDSYPLYSPGSCPHIDEQFNCFINGRPDRDFQKLRWQPKGCNIPRLNGRDMLELLRGKRLVFVGDSLNRNMWESLVCVLRNSVSDKSKVYEASGRREFRTDNSYLFIFKDYNCTVEFFRSPFLVQEWEMPETNGSKKETLRLDLVEKSSSKYKNADIIVFNTGHWWTHEKTSKGKDYYQEGSHVYGELNVVEAFRKALTTWAKWVDVNINPKKTLVFFRGYSASHFSGGQWNSGGQCDDETEPIKNDTYLSVYPPKMRVLESVLHGMKMPVSYLNITRMTDYRKDAHPSIYRKQNVPEEERRSPLRYQDCSHWCLPGVPDSWNELLYAKIKQNRRKQQQQQKQQQQKQPKRS